MGFDANGDGQLSRDELKKFVESMPQRGDRTAPTASEMMSRLDTDGDGQVSASELEAGRPKGPPLGNPDAGEGMPFAAGMDRSQLEAMAARFSTTSGSSMSANDLLTAFDTNDDGAVLAEERQSRRQSLNNQLTSGLQAAWMRRR